MKSRELSRHIWRAIEAQAKVVADDLLCNKIAGTGLVIGLDEIEVINKYELKRLHILICQLEEESPK
jgi:hypothetical protein